MKVYELPALDNRKSFYGKAKVIEKNNGEKVLQSYGREVCKITSGGGKTWWDNQTVNA